MSVLDRGRGGMTVALVGTTWLAGFVGAPPAAPELSFTAREFIEHRLSGDFSEVPQARDVKGKQTGQPGSGGRALAHYPDRKLVRSASVQRKAPDALLFRTGINGAEPTLGITKDGEVLYQGLDFTGPLGLPEPDIARSKDQGATWEVITPMIGPERRHPVTLDPYIYTDDDTSRTFTFDFNFGCSEISFTDDGGDTWTTTPLACGEMDHQTLFTGPPVNSPTAGYPNVVYMCAINGGAAVPPSTATECFKSLNGGLSYTPTGSPPFYTNPSADRGNVGIDGFCDGANGHGFVGPDGTVYLPKGWCGQPWLAISRDEGVTWDRVQVADNGMPLDSAGIYDHEAGVVADSKGNVYYTWVAQDRLPYLAISRDGGATWGKPMMIAPPGVIEASIPGIDIGADGKIAIIYMGSENSPGPPYIEGQEPGDWLMNDSGEQIRKKYEDVTWNGYMSISTNALGKKPIFYTTTVNAKNDPLIRGTCGPFRCQAEYDFLDVQIGPDGTPWGSLVDGCIKICIKKPPTNAAEGIVARLVDGPSLR